MAVLDSRPSNLNFLSPINFKFLLKRAPSTEFFIQRANIPGISLGPVDINNPMIRIPQQGDHLIYEPLNITFKVDEALQNYLEIHNWLRYSGKAHFSEHRALSQAPLWSGNGLKSDIIINLLDSSKQPKFKITFQDAFPISLSAMNFQTTDDDVNYITADASFRYTIYNIENIT